MILAILSIQGDFALHRRMLERLDTEVVEVRRASQLEGLDGIIIPGGESTTFHKILESDGLGEHLRGIIRDGLPTWGTCAGAIMLGRGDGIPQPRWNLLDLEVRRNGYGRQVDSFVAPLKVEGLNGDFSGVFIRAPRFAGPGAKVQPLCMLNDEPVMARQDNILVTAFHPELTDDDRIHRYFIERVVSRA